VATLAASLTHDGLGLCRYADDDYYFSSPFDPAGDEVGAPSPSWPQMSMWVAVFEAQTRQQAAAHSRLQWFVSRTGKGYMPQGEAVSNITHQSVLSSMSEPLTASSFLLAMLCYSGRYDLRVLPPIYNAGAFKSLTVTTGTKGDWDQWGNVPYFVGALAAAPTGAATTIKRVFVANDGSNLYLRVDGWTGSLAGFGAAPFFAVRVYSQDFANGGVEATTQGLDNQPLGRPASFVVERHNDENVFRRWVVQGGMWVSTGAVSGVLPPQWDPARGRVEVAIPLGAVSSSWPGLGASWATLAVALAARDQATGAWTDGPKVLIHYRLSSGNQAWTFGNIEAGV
jgi:hypothetical protein